MKARNLRLSAVTRLALVFALLFGVSATASAQGGAVPDGKVAIIDISAFPERIAELKRKIDTLNTRFEPRSKELQGLRDSIAGIENQVRQGNLSPEQSSQLSDRYEQLKREYQRKSEDLTMEARKAYSDETDPLNVKLSQALQKFAADRGIILIIEVGGARDTGSVFYAEPRLDVTEAFIADYNRANP